MSRRLTLPVAAACAIFVGTASADITIDRTVISTTPEHGFWYDDWDGIYRGYDRWYLDTSEVSMALADHDTLRVLITIPGGMAIASATPSSLTASVTLYHQTWDDNPFEGWWGMAPEQKSVSLTAVNAPVILDYSVGVKPLFFEPEPGVERHISWTLATADATGPWVLEQIELTLDVSGMDDPMQTYQFTSDDPDVAFWVWNDLTFSFATSSDVDPGPFTRLVPEPGGLALTALAGVIILSLRRRRVRARQPCSPATGGRSTAASRIAMLLPLLTLTPAWAGYGDFDGDNDVDAVDFAIFQDGLATSGPTVPYATAYEAADADGDGDIDMSDYAVFQARFTGAGIPQHDHPEAPTGLLASPAQWSLAGPTRVPAGVVGKWTAAIHLPSGPLDAPGHPWHGSSPQGVASFCFDVALYRDWVGGPVVLAPLTVTAATNTFKPAGVGSGAAVTDPPSWGGPGMTLAVAPATMYGGATVGVGAAYPAPWTASDMKIGVGLDAFKDSLLNDLDGDDQTHDQAYILHEISIDTSGLPQGDFTLVLTPDARFNVLRGDVALTVNQSGAYAVALGNGVVGAMHSFTVTPEPATAALGVGLGLVLAHRRHRRHARSVQ